MPRKNTVRLNCHVKQETYDTIERLKEDQGTYQADIVDRAVSVYDKAVSKQGEGK